MKALFRKFVAEVIVLVADVLPNLRNYSLLAVLVFILKLFRV